MTAVSLNANTEVVNIGISTVGLYELPTDISKRKGFYQEEELDVRKVVVRTPLHIAALLEKEIAGKVFFGDHDLARSMTRHVLERFAAAAERHKQPHRLSEEPSAPVGVSTGSQSYWG